MTEHVIGIFSVDLCIVHLVISRSWIRIRKHFFSEKPENSNITFDQNITFDKLKAFAFINKPIIRNCDKVQYKLV